MLWQVTRPMAADPVSAHGQRPLAHMNHMRLVSPPPRVVSPKAPSRNNPYRGHAARLLVKRHTMTKRATTFDMTTAEGQKRLMYESRGLPYTPQVIDTTVPGDYGADPIGDGTFRMVPSGDIVALDERNRRLTAHCDAAIRLC